MNLKHFALLGLLVLAPTFAHATCGTIPGTLGATATCSDVIKYLADDVSANAIVFRMKAQDESNLGCTLTSANELTIAKTATMFNERHQLLLLATATTLPVVITVSKSFLSPFNCIVNDVRIAPF